MSECAAGTNTKPRTDDTDNKQNTREKPATTNKYSNTSIVKYSKL